MPIPITVTERLENLATYNRTWNIIQQWVDHDE
jgi:hypothetical protein